MTAPAQRQPAYVLHRRAYRETSSIVDFLTLEHGRVAGVATGTRGSRRARLVEPFSRLEIGWRGKGRLVTVTGCETVHRWRLDGRRLFAGMYLNELMMRSLPLEDAVTELYRVYEAALAALAAEDDIEPTLRVFEKCLLREIGYGLTFDIDAADGGDVRDDGAYEFVEGAGFRAVAADTPGALPGAVLKDIAHDRYDSAAARRAAKAILRRALKPHLGDRPLASRELFRRV